MVLLEKNAIICEKLAGVPLSVLMKRHGHRLATSMQRQGLAGAGKEVGRWLRWFRHATQKPLTMFRAGKYLSHLREHLDRCLVVGLPRRISEEIWDLASRDAARMDGRLCAAAARHGDFVPQNMLVAQNRVALVDFENFADSDLIYEDLGAFIAYLTLLSRCPVYSPGMLLLMSQAFLQAYGEDVNTDMLRLYVLKSAVAIVSETAPSRGLLDCWRRLFPVWKPLLEKQRWGMLASEYTGAR